MLKQHRGDASHGSCKSADEVAEVVAAMFDAGFCNRDDQPDPAEWISYAVQSIKAIRTATGE